MPAHSLHRVTITDSDRYGALRSILWRPSSGTAIPADVGTSLRGYDPDLLDYVFWAREVRGLAANTVRVRLDFVHRLYLFAGVPLREVHTGHLMAFERLAIAGRAPESRRAYVCHLRAFYRWAVQTRVVSADPTEMLTLPRVPRHLPRPIDEDDLVVALRVARPKMRAMIVLAAFAGLRCIEIAGLDWADLRREPDGSAFIHVRHGKGAKERTVEVGDVVVQALQGHGVRRRGAMFLGQDGQPIDPRSVSRSINRFLANHDIQATAHQLRHRYGTVAYQLSRDLRMVQEQMGHASPQTTAGYTRASREAAAAMVAAMDRMTSTSER